MRTENLDIEYSLFFTIFAKNGLMSLRRLLDKGTEPEHFGSLFHRQVFEHIVKNFRSSGDVMSLKMFVKHFLGRPDSQPDDEIKIKTFVNKVKVAKIRLDDIEHARKMLIECYATRKVLSAMGDVLEELEHKSLENILPKLQNIYKDTLSLLEEESQVRVMGLKDGLQERITRAEEVYKNPDDAGMVCTGLKNLDKFIGRQSPGQLVVYQARTGVGKSMMLMGTAIANFRKGLKVMVITIEMSEYDYLYRFDSNLTGIEHRQFSSGEITKDKDMVDIWKQRIQRLGKPDSDLMVYWVPSQCTPDKVENLIASNPFKPDVVIVDYAGDMKAGLKGVPDYDARSHAEIYSALKEFAGKFKCVLVTAQQSKRGSGGKASTETGAWSDVASAKSDIMLAVEVTKEDEDFMTEVDGNVVIGRMTISIIKGRNIPKCKTNIIPRFQKMSWIEKESEEMMVCGAGKEIKTDKKVKKEQIENAEEELNRAIQTSKSEDEEIDDLFADME